MVKNISDQICYLVYSSYGSYEDYHEIPVLVTLDKELAQKTVEQEDAKRRSKPESELPMTYEKYIEIDQEIEEKIDNELDEKGLDIDDDKLREDVRKEIFKRFPAIFGVSLEDYNLMEMEYELTLSEYCGTYIKEVPFKDYDYEVQS